MDQAQPKAAVPSPPAAGATAVDRTIAITRSMRNFANALMEKAHQARINGSMSLDDYFTVAGQYQTIINQANQACYAAAKNLQPLEAELGSIEAASTTLEQAATYLAKVTDVLAISGDLLEATGALVEAIVKTDASALKTVEGAIASAMQEIHDL